MSVPRVAMEVALAAAGVQVDMASDAIPLRVEGDSSSHKAELFPTHGQMDDYRGEPGAASSSGGVGSQKRETVEA